MEARQDRPATTSFDAGAWRIDDALSHEDARTLAAWLGDPRIAKAMGRPVTTSTAGHIHAFARSLAGRGWLFVIRQAGDGSPVGHGLVEVDPANGVARVDVVVARRAVNPIAVLDAFVGTVGGWLFDVQKVYKVAVHSRGDNRHLREWLDRNLFREGAIRGHIVDAGGRRVDQLVHSVVEDEWRRVVGDAARRAGVKTRA